MIPMNNNRRFLAKLPRNGHMGSNVLRGWNLHKMRMIVLNSARDLKNKQRFVKSTGQ